MGYCWKKSEKMSENESSARAAEPTRLATGPESGLCSSRKGSDSAVGRNRLRGPELEVPMPHSLPSVSNAGISTAVTSGGRTTARSPLRSAEASRSSDSSRSMSVCFSDDNSSISACLAYTVSPTATSWARSSASSGLTREAAASSARSDASVLAAAAAAAAASSRARRASSVAADAIWRRDAVSRRRLWRSASSLALASWADWSCDSRSSFSAEARMSASSSDVVSCPTWACAPASASSSSSRSCLSCALLSPPNKPSFPLEGVPACWSWAMVSLFCWRTDDARAWYSVNSRLVEASAARTSASDAAASAASADAASACDRANPSCVATWPTWSSRSASRAAASCRS